MRVVWLFYPGGRADVRQSGRKRVEGKTHDDRSDGEVVAFGF